MRSIRIRLLLYSLIILFSQTFAQDMVNDKYHRSSLYSIILNHPEQQFSTEIIESFKSIPLPDKYYDHNLKIRVMNAPVLPKLSKEEFENTNRDAIHRLLIRNKIGGRLVEKWFNRDNQTGFFDMNLVRSRGFYDATLTDIQKALKSKRGLSQLEDAGEELLSHTYVLVNDIRYVDKNTHENLHGFGIVVGAMKGMSIGLLPMVSDVGLYINELVVGFKVYVTSYLFRLDWNDEIGNNFYSNLWIDSTFDSDNPDCLNRKSLFNKHLGSFTLTYLGCTTVFSGETSLAGVKHENDMFRKVCTRSIEKSISELQKSFDEFKVYTPLVSAEPILAYIGIKDGVTENSRYEVLEVSQDENGKTVYSRKGIIKPIKEKIWDNRYMAEFEEGYNSSIQGTSFEIVSGKGFYPGMLIREIK